MRLVSVYQCDAIPALYDLLLERTPEQSISHKRMPSLSEHAAFVQSRPYQAWYMIEDGDYFVGSVYLSKQREIGIFIFSRFHGQSYGREAVEQMKLLYPGPMLANINPANEGSIRFFEKLGGRRIQTTYEF